MGATIKSYLAQKQNIDPKDIFVVSVMPCTAKKFEAQRPELSSSRGVADVDAVLTTRQFNRMMQIFGIEFASLAGGGVRPALRRAHGLGGHLRRLRRRHGVRPAHRLPPAHRQGPHQRWTSRTCAAWQG